MNANSINTYTWCVDALPQFDDRSDEPMINVVPIVTPRPRVTDRGQATTEYALVMLGAAAIALLVIAWATAGGGAGSIGRLFDQVIDSVVSRI